MRLPFEFGVITDEIDQDLDHAVSVAADLGIRHVELNGIWGKNVIDLSPEEVSRARRLIDAAGMRVVAVGPPSFKSCVIDQLPAGAVTDDAEFRRHLETVKRGAERAHQFGATLVRVFSFRRRGIEGLGNPSPRLPAGGPLPDTALERIAEGFAPACRLAEAEDVVLALENVRSCWGNSGENTGRILARVNSPRLRAIWDPGNDYVSGGAPYPEGYEAVRPFMVHVHVKDAAVRDENTGRTSWEAIGAGAVDYREQLLALVRDDFRGVVSLETHWRPDGGSGEVASRESFAGLLRVVASLED